MRYPSNDIHAKQQLASASEYYMTKMGYTIYEYAQLMGVKEDRLEKAIMRPEDEEYIFLDYLESSLRKEFLSWSIDAKYRGK